MSEQGAQLIRDGVEAINRADADALVALLDPDVEWEAGDDRFPGFQPVYRGRTAVRQWMQQALEPWESFHNDIEEITEVEDGLFLLGLRMETRGKTSGIELELEMWQLLWLADGLLTRRTGPFTTREAALAASTDR